MEARGALYILTYEYNYKVITIYDTILQEYYITDIRKCENSRRYTSMNSTNGAHEFTKGKLERCVGAWKDSALDGLPMIHATAAPLKSTTGRIHKFQAPRPRHEDSGESELPSEW